MMNDKRKVLLPAVLFALGAASGVSGLLIAQQYQPRFLGRAKASAPQDFVSRMKWQHNAMNALLKQTFDQVGDNEAMWAPFGEEKEIAVDETGHEFVYRIPIGDMKDKKVNVDVRDGYVTVTAKSGTSTVENTAKGDDLETNNRNEFYGLYKRTFPLVAGANPAKMEFSLEKDSVVIRFSKLKGA